mgnify:CR=1 FL=1
MTVEVVLVLLINFYFFNLTVVYALSGWPKKSSVQKSFMASVGCYGGTLLYPCVLSIHRYKKIKRN